MLLLYGEATFLSPVFPQSPDQIQFTLLLARVSVLRSVSASQELRVDLL